MPNRVAYTHLARVYVSSSSGDLQVYELMRQG